MIYKVTADKKGEPFTTNDIDNAISQMAKLRKGGDIAILEEKRGAQWWTLTIWGGCYSYEEIWGTGVLVKNEGAERIYCSAGNAYDGEAWGWTKILRCAKGFGDVGALHAIRKLVGAG